MFAEDISVQREGEAKMSYVWTAIIGFVAGLIARALHPGDDKLGFIMNPRLRAGLVPPAVRRPSVGPRLVALW